nr:hypothetical protein [Tanacetum cinerariifolium]
GPNCHGCALLRQELEKNLVEHSPDFQNSSESSNASTNVVDAPREPNVAKQNNGSFVDKIIFRAPDSPDQFHCFHCKDVLRAGEACKRCTCAKCRSGLGKGLCYICGHNQNSLNDSPSIFESSSQSPSNINHCCSECGDPLDGIFCKRCTSESPFTLDSTPTYVDESPNIFNPHPQSPVYPCEFCENDAYYGNLEYRDEIKIAELKENFNGMSIEIRKKEKLLQEEQWAYLSTHPSKRLLSFCFDDDDDEDYASAITPNEPVLSTEEPDNSLNQVEDLSESNEEFSSIDDDSFSIDDIDYVEASPPDSELVSSEVMEIVIPEVGGIDDDILLTINHDDLREKLRNLNLLISKIEALNANPTPSSDCKTKSSSTSLTSLLEETNTFDNSLPEFETFCFDVEEISSGSTTTHPDLSLPEYEAFHDNHVKEISSGSPTTPSNISLSEYDSFMFDLS